MDKTNVSKVFKNFNFVIDKSKSVRINDIVESHFKKIKSGTFSTSFEVLLNNEKEFSLNKFSKIFELDNGRKNKIRRIKSVYKKGNNELQLIYSDTPKVEIEVSGEELDWSNELFVETEEQLNAQRTILL